MSMIGDNTQTIDYAKEEVERLAREYGQFVTTVEELTAEAEAIPEEIDGPETKEVVVDLIKRIRDAKGRIEALQVVEKQPFLRRGQGVDQFFFGLWDRLLKRAKHNRDGIGDSLNQKLTRYDVRMLAEENERRRKAAEETARIHAAAEQARLEAERKAEEARLAAERARKPETTAAKQEIAEQAAEAASAARVEETVAASSAEQAHVDTLAKPADVMRTRTSAGTLSTMQTETFAEIEDQTKLDMALLWPFIKFDAKEAALKAWARGTDHRVQMAGAKIGRRPKSQVR